MLSVYSAAVSGQTVI